jgi:cytochrome bd-type quinol oxidase subunit 1
VVVKLPAFSFYAVTGLFLVLVSALVFPHFEKDVPGTYLSVATIILLAATYAVIVVGWLRHRSGRQA